jgi:ubiquinone/menaquinone biosynthesis C-methylase UbiE
MKRVVVPELLDEDRGTAQEVADSLADLRMLNRYFGGISTSVSLLRRVANHCDLKALSLLDVAGASGDIASTAQQMLAKEGIALTTTVLDLAPSHLKKDHYSICGSAFALPFADQSFDVVASALFLHHLERDEIAQFIGEAIRVCRRAVIVNDLRRSLPHWLAAKAGSLIYRSVITRHDAPVSVRRAYTIDEMRGILADAGQPLAEFSHHFFYRMGVIIWRKDPS